MFKAIRDVARFIEVRRRGRQIREALSQSFPQILAPFPMFLRLRIEEVSCKLLVGRAGDAKEVGRLEPAEDLKRGANASVSRF